MKLNVKPIPVPASSKHPPPPDDTLPAHEFTIGIIGILLQEKLDLLILQ